MDNISTHVLDTSRGTPAGGIQVALFQQENKYIPVSPIQSAEAPFGEEDYTWKLIQSTVTDNNGRARFEFSIEPQTYKMVFFTQSYFQLNGTTTFYPKVEIIFRIIDITSHYHVPLILGPYGYSTYRGS